MTIDKMLFKACFGACEACAYTWNRLAGDGIQFRQRQAAQGVIEECQSLRGLVDDVAGGRVRFLRNDGPYHAGNTDFSLVIGGIDAIAGQVPISVKIR